MSRWASANQILSKSSGSYINRKSRQTLEWSHYQNAIFDFHDNGEGDVFVSAAAGSSKTTTLVECAHRLPEELRSRSIFVAFNKHIATELSERLPEGVRAQTIHSIGFSAIGKWSKEKYEIEKVNMNDRKYKQLIKAALHTLRIEKSHERYQHLTDLTKMLVHYTQVTLTDHNDPKAIKQMALSRGIESTEWDFGIALQASIRALNWGLKGLPVMDDDTDQFYHPKDCISFNDMIWLPNVIPMKMPKYDRIYVDESQDLSAAQREIVLKMRSKNGRIFFVGDKRQAIYAFSGADEASIDAIISVTNAITLPLSISYRCPKSHIRLAQTIVPEIEAWDKAPEGILGTVTKDKFYHKVKPEDIVLCRMTAPLVELALQMIGKGIAVYVKGKDLGEGLKFMVDAACDHIAYEGDNFVHALEAHVRDMVALLSEKEDSDIQIESLQDRSLAVQMLYEQQRGAGKVESLKTAIDVMFGDDAKGVTLSTVHRAKGCEADTIYILENCLMPHPRAVKPISIAQEYNLKYVAYTRSKNALYFIDEPVPESGMESMEDRVPKKRPFFEDVCELFDQEELLIVA